MAASGSRAAAPVRPPTGEPPVVPLTRLAPPKLPRAVTLRTRLLETLSTAVERPLTLLVAPAGSGKTVLLCSWLANGAAPKHVAWLTLDRADNDPTRFWGDVLAAIQRSGVQSETSALAAPRRNFDEEFLATLMNELCAMEESLILVIDDFDAIGESTVLEGVDYVLRHAPPQLRLVLATRCDPQLSLGRLRVRRDLTEIRAAALAFTDEEGGDLLAASGLELPDSDVETLVARTEGWAAGLALAAMSLEGASDPGERVARFAGDDRAVADFLASEVLARMNPDVHHFLAETSVVDEICPSLAEALTGRTDSGEMLHELVRTNSFVVAVDSNGGWYRYHNLFLQFLRTEGARRGNGAVPALHRRAAEWLAAHDLPLDAIRHALTAEDWALATTLVREHWLSAFHSGRVATMSHLLARLPSRIAADDPLLALAYAASFLELGALRETDRYLEIARQPRGLPESDTFVEALAVVTLGRASICGDLEAAVTSARTLMADNRADESPRMMRRPRRRALTLLLLGQAELWAGRLDDAQRHLRTALALAREAEEDYLVLGCLAHLALLDALQGRLRPAAELAQDAIELARMHGYSSDSAVAPAHLALATAQLEWNDPAAAGSIRPAVSATADSGNAVLRVAVALAEARICARDGGPTGAQRGLEQLEVALDRVGTVRLPRFLDDRVGGTIASLSLAVGETSEAEAWLQGTQPSAYVAVVEARLALANAEPDRALRALAPYVDGAHDTYLGTRVEALVLKAVAHRARFEPELAAHSLERALDLADPDGFRWRFVKAGAVLRELLTGQIRSGTAHRALVDELLMDMGAGAPSASPPAQDRQLLDPLTDREETVLRYLPTLLSNAEIASELFVSINTVKAHVKSIYRKLGTSRRKDAVLRARDLRLL